MKVITPFIDPLTRKKIVFDSPLQEHVPPTQLCQSHGGTLEFDYDHSVYWPALNKLADDRRAALLERWRRGGSQVGEYEAYLKGGTDRSVADDLKDNPNEQKRGQRLGGATDGGPLPKDRNVVVLSRDGAAVENAAEGEAAA